MTAAERKDARLHIRLTPSQDRALSERARAAGVTKTDYVTAALEGTVLLPAADRDLLRALLLELARQGNNLTQVAHRLNALSRVDPLGCADAIASVSESQAARVEAYRAVRDALSSERRART